MSAGHHLVAGGAGFVGVNLCRALLARGMRLTVVDNLSRGRRDWVDALGTGVRFLEADVSDAAATRQTFANVMSAASIDEVWHLCANSDIAAGVADPTIDLRDTFLTTFNILAEMKRHGLGTLHFASTSAVYGEPSAGRALSEDDRTQPISNYGAMKLASEAQIRAAVEAGLARANIFRFPNVIGTPATHGVIFDFVHKLRADPARLDVLGDGTQKKPYLHVDELVDALLFIRDAAVDRFALYNIGPRDDGVTVRDIAEAVRDTVSPSASIHYGAETRGWVGDVPRFHYATTRLADLGWRPKFSSLEAVRRCVPAIAGQDGA